jgi:hypothetical protein
MGFSTSSQELLTKALSCLLLPKTIPQEYKLTTKKSSTFLKQILVKVDQIKLPLLPPSNSKLVLELLTIMNVDESIANSTLQSIRTETNLTAIVHDLYIYRHLLQKDCVPFLPKFANADQCNLWKQKEDAEIASLISDSFPSDSTSSLKNIYGSLNASRKYILLNIIEASNLSAKDTKKTSNPYCSITYAGMQFNTQVITRNCNPKFNFSLAL